VKGSLGLVVVRGRAPTKSDEIAFAPATMHALKVHIGDQVRIGADGTRRATVVGTALLPATSHTDYDQSGWMTAAGLRAALPPADQRGPDDIQDFVLLTWRHDAPVAAEQRKLGALGADQQRYYFQTPELPGAVVDLGRLRSLPLTLGVFFGLLACATVVHALVTTVRRRRHDLAVMRAFGFTRRQSRIAIAWQATLLAIVGLVIGVPLGVATGRVLWRSLADTFPVVYAAPLALLAVVLVTPATLALANLLAAGPAQIATRIRPAEALRTE
jgi:predicted lysophospholipase L1 biosynthesis ABC-type transport system permease subunit